MDAAPGVGSTHSPAYTRHRLFTLTSRTLVRRRWGGPASLHAQRGRAGGALQVTNLGHGGQPMPRCSRSGATATRVRGGRFPELVNSCTSRPALRRIPRALDLTLLCSRAHAETPQHRELVDLRSLPRGELVKRAWLGACVAAAVASVLGACHDEPSAGGAFPRSQTLYVGG